jgi:hypothetical protein
MKTGRKITYEAVFSQVYGSFGRVQGSFEAELGRALRDRNTEKGKLPPWYPRFPGWEEIETTPAINMVDFIVCGDPARNKVQILAGGPGAASRKSKLPAKWDELMEKAGYRPLQEFFLKVAVVVPVVVRADVEQLHHPYAPLHEPPRDQALGAE